MELIELDIAGLSLLLGGGIRAISRFGESAPSATILLRGPPGSGKTIFGAQIAASLARRRSCDIAYGCLELLPIELKTQLLPFQNTSLHCSIITPQFTHEKLNDAPTPRVFAGLLDIGSFDVAAQHLGGAISSLLDAVKAGGGFPGILVLDSLSDGYGLASALDREIADSVCKLAAEAGLILIIIEETDDTMHSAWSFVTDTVLDLGIEDNYSINSEPRTSRRCTIIKNRLGPCIAGPHRFEIHSQTGVTISPRPESYLQVDSTQTGIPQTRFWDDDIEQVWGIPFYRDRDPPNFRGSVTTVYATDLRIIRRFVQQLGGSGEDGLAAPGTDLHVSFGGSALPNAQIIDTRNPFLRGDEFLCQVINKLREFRGQGEVSWIRRFYIGDLRAIVGYWNPEELRRAILVLIQLLRERRIPIIIFETPVMDRAINLLDQGDKYLVHMPGIYDADVVVSIRATEKDEFVATATVVSSGMSTTWRPRVLNRVLDQDPT